MKAGWMALAMVAAVSGLAAQPGDTRTGDQNARWQVPRTATPLATTSASGDLLLPLNPTATPQRVARPLVSDEGCCVNLSWSPDSQWVAYIARPRGAATAGIYGAAVDGTKVRRLYSRVGLLSPDWKLMAYPADGKTVLMSTSSGRTWAVPAAGKAVRFSPSGSRVVWETGTSTYAHLDLRRRVIWMAEADGSQAHRVVTTFGGGFIGWSGDESSLLVSGRLSSFDPRGIWSIPLDASPSWLLFEADRIRDPLLSPDGRWLAFYIAFDNDPSRNGLWLVSTDGTVQHQLPVFGAYRWRSDDQLLVILQDLDSEKPRLVQVDAPTGAAIELTLPGTEPAISGNEWQPSPDGQWVAYVSAESGGLMLAPLP